MGAPFPPTTVTFVLEFRPHTRRYLEAEYAGFYGPTAKLTIVDDIAGMSGPMKLVTERMRQWVCSGIVSGLGKGEGRELPNGGREWSITWQEFNASMAQHTCTSANSPGGAQSVPYVLTQFRQSLLDDNGHQVATFTFAVYAGGLDAWVAAQLGRRD